MNIRRYNIKPEDVKNVRSRRAMNHRYAEVISRLHYVKQSFIHLTDNQNELYRYYPTALFACIETWTRMAVCDLVNFGEPYRSNARKLMNNQKIDFDVVTEIGKEYFTLGDLVSHSLSISKLDHVFDVMSELLNSEFRDCVAEACDNWEMGANNKHGTMPIIPNFDQTCEWVEKMIKWRNIFCHETALAKTADKTDIEQYILHTRLIIDASNEVVDNIINPYAQLTSKEFNIEAQEKERKSREMLEKIIERVSIILSPCQQKLIDEVNEAWERYLSKSVEIWSLDHEGMPKKAGIESFVKKAIIDQRIEQLKKLYEYIVSVEEPNYFKN